MLKATHDLDVSLTVFEFWKKHLSMTKGDDSLFYPELTELGTSILCLRLPICTHIYLGM